MNKLRKLLGWLLVSISLAVMFVFFALFVGLLEAILIFLGVAALSATIVLSVSSIDDHDLI